MHTMRKTKRARPAGSKALTLVESLVAISILVIAVFGPMSIVSQSIRTAYLTRDQMTAFYLAQEAIEYVRNAKDRNSLHTAVPSTWLDNIDPNGSLVINDFDAANPAKYELHLSPGGIYDLAACGSICAKLNINPTTREYGAPAVSSTDIPSIYTREVTFWKVPSDPSAAQEIMIQVVMKWSHTGSAYEYVVRDYLKNWKLTP